MPAEGALRDRTAAGFELIETLRWATDEGFERLERHLARLTGSARELGFACDEAVVRETLSCAVENAQATRRVRLTLEPGGQLSATAQPFSPQSKETVWRLAIATTRLNSGDQLLRHKTTRRAVYDKARGEFSRDNADEVLLANEHGEVCEGTITNLFVDTGDGGPLLTPPLSCGLLAGVLRAEMIEAGKAREAVLTAEDLRAAKSLYVGNSLRGLIRAQLT